jgi:hypothetical protein
LPADDPFYTPPPGYQTEHPGTILRNRSVPYPLAGFGVVPVNVSAAYQILYRSTDTFGNAIAIVSTILVPQNASNTKLLSYQVAEDAADPSCCPSYVFQQGSQTGGVFGTIVTELELSLIQSALNNGWYVTVPDFLGLKSAFLANTLAGYAVLDGIRATLASSDITLLGSDPTLTMWGYSGGSMATEFAAELQPTYAPEFKIAGAALGGTIPNILTVLYTINKGAFAGLIATGVVGLGNEYPEIASLIASELLPNKTGAIQQRRTWCLGAAVMDFAFQDIFSYVKDPSIFNSTTVTKILDANNPGHHTPQIPLMVYKSATDEISPVADTDKLVQSYCNDGASVDYRREGLDHLSLMFTGAPDALNWLKDRLNGVPAQQGCTNTTG